MKFIVIPNNGLIHVFLIIVPNLHDAGSNAFVLTGLPSNIHRNTASHGLTTGAEEMSSVSTDVWISLTTLITVVTR